MDTKTLILDAANVLINDPNASELYQQLVKVLALPDDYKVKLADEASVLNPLLKLGRESRIKMDRVIDMVELRREARGMEPLKVVPGEAPFNKNEYQRKLMAERRARTVKASEVENLRRPPSGQLIGHARMEFQRVQQKKWSTRLDELVATRLGAGPVAKADRARIAEEFWASVDQELDEAQAAVYQWIQSGRKGPAP